MLISENKIEQLKNEMHLDQELQQKVKASWPLNKATVPIACRPYWNFRDEISICDSVILKGETVQNEMLKIIHASHMGIVKFKQRAKDLVYWPGMSSQIEDVVSNCSICNTYRQSNTKELMIPHNVPIRPWSQVGADLFELNRQHYFLLFDYYPGFIKVNTLNNTNHYTLLIPIFPPQHSRCIDYI